MESFARLVLFYFKAKSYTYSAKKGLHIPGGTAVVLVSLIETINLQMQIKGIV